MKEVFAKTKEHMYMMHTHMHHGGSFYVEAIRSPKLSHLSIHPVRISNCNPTLKGSRRRKQVCESSEVKGWDTTHFLFIRVIWSHFNFCELQFLYLDNWKIGYIERLWDLALLNKCSFTLFLLSINLSSICHVLCMPLSIMSLVFMYLSSICLWIYVLCMCVCIYLSI